jgi:hypothetical protein
VTDDVSARSGLSLLPLVIAVAGVAMVAVYVVIALSGVFRPYATFLVLGGPLATGAAAVLGRRSRMMFKEVLFLLIVCSVLGGLANYVVFTLLQERGVVRAIGVGTGAGTAVAAAVAYVAGMLARRGADVRHKDEILETFR